MPMNASAPAVLPARPVRAAGGREIREPVPARLQGGRPSRFGVGLAGSGPRAAVGRYQLADEVLFVAVKCAELGPLCRTWGWLDPLHTDGLTRFSVEWPALFRAVRNPVGTYCATRVG